MHKKAGAAGAFLTMGNKKLGGAAGFAGKIRVMAL
jgi:hypothetical protein